ncbi:MAG: hypothetical protein ABSH32_00390 [Bryobacteraceae bacterium]|jgi:hypothetical protein
MWDKLISGANRAIALLIFFGLCATYASLTPGAIAGMGYTGEEMQAGDSMLAIPRAILSGQPLQAIKWSRHGPLPVILDLPFLALGRWVVSEEFTLCFEPVLFTALLVTLLFVWLGKLTCNGLAFLLAMAGAFGTMFWPYAYIGLELKQSFFLILAGYLGLACGPIRSYSRALLFGISCAIAISAKSTGIVLLPAVAYLFYIQFREPRRQRIRFGALVVSAIGVAWVLNSLGRAQFWSARGGAFRNLRPLFIGSPFAYFSNMIGMLGSPTKGLFLFAPPLLVSVYAVPKAWRAHRDVTAFALLVVGGVMCGFAFLRFFADEVWGPRYLHCCVAPLLLIIGASRTRFSLRRDALLIPLTALGVAVSFLGAIYYYGVLHFAAIRTSQNSAEQLVGDPVWNQVQFNARLFEVWLKHPPGRVPWTPTHLWMYKRPPDLPPDKSIDLREFAQPQAMLVRFWGVPRPRLVSIVCALLLACAILGPLLLTGAGYLIWSQRVRSADEGVKEGSGPAVTCA